jgi:serine protease Do
LRGRLKPSQLFSLGDTRCRARTGERVFGIRACSAFYSRTGIYSLCAQTSAAALRDYVAVIHQSYHPEVVYYVNTLKKFAENRGEDDMARSIDAFLKGGFGSGFVYVDAEGNNYIITNYHVIARAYSISIEFEKADGAKTVFAGFNVLAADEDLDIALLAFPGP